MLPVGAERANIARGVVYQAMTDHLILPLEALAPFATGTPFHRTIVWPFLRMNVGVGIEKVLRLEGGRAATRHFANVCPLV